MATSLKTDKHKRKAQESGKTCNGGDQKPKGGGPGRVGEAQIGQKETIIWKDLWFPKRRQR